MSNSSDSGTRTVTAHKAGKIVSVRDENMIPQKNIWRFFTTSMRTPLNVKAVEGGGRSAKSKNCQYSPCT